VGLLTGWGRGIAALPASAADASAGRAVIAAMPSRAPSDRLRRATRECLLAVEAVDALLEDAGLSPAAIAGAGTALVYVTAAAYGASNRAFIEGGGGALHFPYTAPSAVPAEVAIEFGLHGPYTVLIGGAAATIDALGHAATLLERAACERAIVLAVETFAECEALHARGRWLVERPLVEAAAAALLEPGTRQPAGGVTGAPAAEANGWRGNAGAAGPLIALSLARARGATELTVRGRWRGREASLTLGLAASAAA
jgi:3-oxoacyl-(acyl-carrier-protein) synthase